MWTYPDEVVRVVRVVGNAFKCGTVFDSADDIRAVLLSVDCGLCSLTKDEHHQFRLWDRPKNVVLGVELTSLGLQLLGYDEENYHRFQ